MKNKYTEICPSCSADEGYLMGTGTHFKLYYNCYSCGHHFVVDGTQYVNEENETRKQEDVRSTATSE